jgi:endonuclease-3
MAKIKLIENYLDELFDNPKCELNYNNDYELLIAICLSAQTTDKRVNKVTSILFNKYKDLQELKMADISSLKKIVRELGNYNKKAKYIKEISTILVDKYNCIVPKNRKQLENLPGVGRKTINVFLSELNIEDNIAVDTHVNRISKRLLLADKNDNVLEVEKKLRRKFKKINWNKRHLQLVLFGRYKCKAINPECTFCKLKNICNYYKGVKNEKNID